ncbi:GRB2-related adapter protein-like isoform X1 [Coregonus clupeaformis]|uniref:GRB2-related adapter protein-like isoform X1 n=1 Tax=Coregonus clupeaformis TaxID=59861 RepID=UPI001BE0D4FA|nr:GRB2-related adapter protein-like isoform X1 [Coregonus clupeaformis]
MEAVAVFSFRATERDELSFQKGEILKVTEMDEDPNWMMAELHGKRGYVPENYISLLPHPYGDMVEHFLVLEGLGQYCVWEETFSSLNRLVDFYRSHSIARERPVYLTDPPHTPSHTPLHTHTPAHPSTHTAMHLPDPNPNPYTPLRTHTHTPNPYLAEHHTPNPNPNPHHPAPTPNPNPNPHHPAPACYSKRGEPSRDLHWGYATPT